MVGYLDEAEVEETSLDLFRIGIGGRVYHPVGLGDGCIILGDLIVALNGTAIKVDTDLFAALADRRLGETVELTIHRRGKTIKVPVTLGVLPE